MTTKENITKSFWKPCEEVLKPETKMLKPNFAEINCVHYLRNTLKLKTRHKRFTSPSGMREFENPAYDFKIQPPTFAEITKFIMKMKFSASPRPLDQISVITFKKCPVLTSRLKNILQTA